MKMLLKILVFWLGLSGMVFGQFTYHSWTDSIPVTTTDTSLTASLTEYHQLTITPDTVDVLVKWNNAKTYFRLPAGASLVFGSYDKVSTMTVKTTSGAGILYTVGIKAGKQQTSAKNF